MEVDQVFRHVWILFIASNVVIAVNWWVREHPPADADSEIRRSLLALIKGFLFWANLPWLAIGLLIFTGKLQSTWDLFKLRSGDPYVVTWYALVVFLWVLGTRWLFSGGAEILVKHAGLLNFKDVTPAQIKSIWLICIAGGCAAVLMLCFGLVPA